MPVSRLSIDCGDTVPQQPSCIMQSLILQDDKDADRQSVTHTAILSGSLLEADYGIPMLTMPRQRAHDDMVHET